MRARLVVAGAIVCVIAVLGKAESTPVADRHVAGDPAPLAGGAPAAPCSFDQFCSNLTLTQGFVADGEWIPGLPQIGFVTTNNTIVTLDGACAVLGQSAITGPGFPGPVTRSFAWGVQGGDSWVGSWQVPGGPTPELYHLDSSLGVIASYVFNDPGTGAAMQISGLAMDADRGDLWAILRNNNPNDPPNPPVSRFVEFDITVDPPVIIQGPIDVPWPGGPSAVSSAGLDYNSQDCTLLALRQDPNNVGQTALVVFQDLNPSGAGGVTLLGECAIANQPCRGAGTTPNRPWGVALIEGASPYAIYSDLNLLADCAMIEQPADFHLAGLPPFSGQCAAPVTPSTWGQIKARFAR